MPKQHGGLSLQNPRFTYMNVTLVARMKIQYIRYGTLHNVTLLSVCVCVCPTVLKCNRIIMQPVHIMLAFQARAVLINCCKY